MRMFFMVVVVVVVVESRRVGSDGTGEVENGVIDVRPFLKEGGS
jgi:hypothetical protein